MRRRVGGAIVLGLLLAAAAGIGLAVLLGSKGPDPAAVPTSEQVQARIMSPFCPGLSLAECPSGEAAELRARIGRRILEGWTNRRIDAWLVADYGEGVLGRPRDLAAWVAPAVALLAGAIGVGAALSRKATGGREAATDPGPAPTAAERARLRDDLERYAAGGTE
ncbi:MAG: cytochrome c-type biogenesis protein [Actinomycetota bacterium]